MTENPEFMPALPRTVLFMAYPGVGLLDLSGAQTVFWAASRAMNQRNLPGYQPCTASLAGGRVRTAEGLVVETHGLQEVPACIDTLIVSGSPSIDQVLAESGELVRWIAEHSRLARRTASVCSGTFLLAEAGLLDGKRAVTHWALCERLEARFPSIEVEREAIFVQQDGIWTSAGVSAGFDMALALVEADCGREVAMQVARELAVLPTCPRVPSPFNQPLHVHGHDGMQFDELHNWLAANLGTSNLGVEALAEHCHMSPRNFSRLYKQKTGHSPAKAVAIFRLEAARRLLEESDRHIDQIARQCGFGDEERMRTTFQRHLATSPRGYRKRFML